MQESLGNPILLSFTKRYTRWLEKMTCYYNQDLLNVYCALYAVLSILCIFLN